ncbi:MAG: flagellar assembly protein FliX [Devosia sp.]
MPVRIEGQNRIGGPVTRATGRPQAEGSFTLQPEKPASQAAGAAPAASFTGIDALLALQAVDDALQSKRKAVRRGRSLIEALEGLQADLLAGQPSEGRLNRLMALLAQPRDFIPADVAALLADIELRARVELAKRGHFPL